MQLQRYEKVEWRLQSHRTPNNGIPLNPKYSSIHQYTCGICGERKFYNGELDPDMPQSHTLRRITKLGYGIGILVCHVCWHEKGYKNPLVKHSSNCRICELEYANRVARRRTKAEAKLAEEARKNKHERFEFTKQVPAFSQHKRDDSSVSVPERRSGNKHKKAQRLRRRRSS